MIRFIYQKQTNVAFSHSFTKVIGGVNKVTVHYPGNTNFNPASVETSFNVIENGPKYTYIKLNNINDVAYGEYTNISGYYFYANDIPLTNTQMKIQVNNKTYTIKTDDKGYFSLNYQTERVFKNNVTVSYHGNTNFSPANASKTFKVNVESKIDTYIDLNNIDEGNVGQTTIISGYYRYGNAMPLSQATMFMHFIMTNGVLML